MVTICDIIFAEYGDKLDSPEVKEFREGFADLGARIGIASEQTLNLRKRELVISKSIKSYADMLLNSTQVSDISQTPFESAGLVYSNGDIEITSKPKSKKIKVNAFSLADPLAQTIAQNISALEEQKLGIGLALEELGYDSLVESLRSLQSGFSEFLLDHTYKVSRKGALKQPTPDDTIGIYFLQPSKVKLFWRAPIYQSRFLSPSESIEPSYTSLKKTWMSRDNDLPKYLYLIVSPFDLENNFDMFGMSKKIIHVGNAPPGGQKIGPYILDHLLDNFFPPVSSLSRKVNKYIRDTYKDLPVVS